MQAGNLISGKYRLQRVLGMGSMGSVWAARNELTNRDFAVKFLRPELSKNQEALNRFFLEARACGQIRHPAIVDVYDMGQAEDGSPYLVMELLEGEGFDERIARQGTLRSADACRYLALIARGLEEAHTRGLIHRDLKPGNIFFAIDKLGEVAPKVLDFGISKHQMTAEQCDFVTTSAGTVLGSPAYMSPEQAKGEGDVDARADLWALGVILYEALTGEVPFDAANYNALMLCIITEPHKPVSQVNREVPPALSAVIDNLLKKDRSQRIRSAGQLATELERVYATLTSTPFTRPERGFSIPPADGVTQTGWYKVPRHGFSRVPAALIVGAALALLGLVGGGIAVSTSAAPLQMDAQRMAPDVNAVVARADARAAEQLAQARTRAAEKEVAEARAETERVARENEERENERNAARRGGAAGTPKNPVHGGVGDPGF